MSRALAYALLAAGALVLVLVGLPFLLLAWILFAGEGRVGTVRDEATAQLAGASLTLERRFAHPFLAEYHRGLTVASAGGGTTRIALGMDTGGMARVTVCRSSTGGILVHDAWETYELILERTLPALTPQPALRDQCPAFLGAFDVDAKLDLSFRPHVEPPPAPRETGSPVPPDALNPGQP